MGAPGRRGGRGRDALAREIEEGYADTDAFAVDDEDAVEAFWNDASSEGGIGSTDARLARPHAGTARR